MSDDPIKDALNMISYGFYSVTSRDGDEFNAMVANWLTQASFEPRLMAMGLQKRAYSYGLIEKAGVFVVNIFRREDQEAIMGLTKSRAKNPDKMKNASYSIAPVTGCPIIDGAAAYIECKVVDLIDVGGDHDILIGEAVGAGVHKPGEPADTLTLSDIGWSYAG